MTPTQINNAARRRLNAINSNFWSDTEVIEECLYFAALELCARAKVYEATSSGIVSVAGTADYTIPTGTIEIKQIVYDNQKLSPMSEREYFAMNLAGSSVPQGRPTHYFLWGSQYTLYPTPDTSSLSIVIKYISEPGSITTATTLTSIIPVQFHPRLVNGVVYYMDLKEVEDPRIPLFRDMWEKDIEATVAEWRRHKHADKLPRVRLEENLLTTELGIT